MQKYYETTLRLWKLLKPFHKHFYVQLLFILATQILVVLLTIVLSRSINFIVEKDFEKAVLFVGIYFLLSNVNTIISYFKQRNSIIHINLSISQYLQEYSFNQIFKLNVSQYLEDHSAIKLQTINRGEEAVRIIVTTIILDILPAITQITFSILAIAYFSVPSAILALTALLIGIFWTNKFTKFHRPFIKKDIDLWDNQRKNRTEAFQHLSLIKVTGVVHSYIKEYLKSRFTVVEHSIVTRQLQNKHSTLRWMFYNTTNALNRISVIYYVYLEKINIGDMYAIWTWLNDANNNIFALISAMREIPINFVELNKYLDIIDKKPLFKEDGIKTFEIGDISFEHLSFKYPKAHAGVIDNLNITIPHGKKVAFVGFSGSGKSTIIKLLLRVYDWTSGDIKIGKDNRVSLRTIDSQTLRQKIGYVEQHVDLFDITIKENILFGVKNRKLSEDKLLEIVQKARIDQFFHRLGDSGLDTIIGERGVKLSGGERQRIGIARALAKDPEILIFDEATASLDTENEKYIQEAIDESSKGRTTIIIAHRLSTIQNSDIIFVMDKGKIVGTGKHNELKETCPEYQRLIHAQEK